MFVQSTSEEKRHSIKKYVKWMTLLSAMSWTHLINNFGCSACSGFLERDKVKPWPTPAISFVTEAISDNSTRERLMAYSIYKESSQPQYN